MKDQNKMLYKNLFIFNLKKLKISLQILMKGELIHQPKKKEFKEREFKIICEKYLCNTNDLKLYKTKKII
jgi:hypothetical protein